MAFDHNLVSKDLRPVNVARPLLDDSRIGVVGGAAAGTVMSPEFFTAAPEGTIPVFYPAAVPDSGGFVGVGYRNVAPAAVAAQWVPVPAAAAGNVNIGVTAPAAVGYGYNPNSLGSRVVGNAVDQASTEMLVGGFGSNPRANPNSNSDLLSSGYGGGGGVDHTSEDGGDDSMSGKKIKLLCSFGGRILPRPSDGALRYVGGQTRIISVRRETTFGELMQKMVDTYGQPVVMKYQLPEEDLDALVSVSCPEDLDNMLDEYEKLVERSSDGSGKLRVFLFSGTEVDASGMVQLGDMQDNGQRYVDAVNGIVVDNAGGGMISGKESTASASSTQNSDVSGAEGADIPGFGQGEVCGTPSASGLSPRGNSVTSQDAAPRLLSVDPNPNPNPPLYADMPSVSLGIPLVKSGSPPALVSHHEVDFERSAAPMNISQQQMGYEQLPQTGMPVQSNAPHLPAYRDYLHAAPQMGYPNAQRLTPAGGSLFAQQPIHDANASLSPHHYMPGVHMTMAPSSSLAPMRPTMVQPMMQAQPTRMDHYPDEKMYGTRIMQVPVDPSYNMYQAQVPQPAIIGGGYSWRQVPQPEHVVYSDGMIRHQQVHYPEKASRPDDCLMCQKALPHAHSDPVVHEQSPLSLDSVYHSLRMEESSKVRPLNRVMVTGATGEATVAAPSEAMDLAQCAEAFHEAEKISPRMMGAPPEQPKMSAPLGMMGIQGDAQSTYGLLMGTMPQSRADDPLLQQHAVAAPRLAGGGLAVQASEGMIYESPRAPYVGNLPLPVQASEGMIYESPRAPYVGNLPHVVSKENIIDSFVPNDQLKPIEGNKSAIDQKLQQGVPSRELLPDSNYLKQELQPAADFSYLHSSQPIEPYDVARSLYSGDPGAHLHSMVGAVLDSGDVSCVNPQYVVEPVYQADRVPPPVSESKSNYDISKLLPSSLASEVESLSLSGNPPSSASSSSRLAAGMQESSDSLFSNQDPWNLRHDTHFPPPKPLKIATRKDTFGAGDPFKQNNIGNVAESVPDVLLDDGISQTLRGSEPTLSSKGSEDRLIKQELQAVAEGVAASVLKSSTQSTDLTGHERNESPPEASEQPKEAAPVKDVEAQHKAKAEDLKNKQPEKVNVGFPKSEGAGRLQIIKSGDLEELFELGSGTFGTVYHGKWRGTDVAIKRINDRCFAGKPSEQERMIDDFWNEAIKLADLHHPNVVAFYGVVLDGPGGSVATVTEYMVNGSLRTALQKNERCLDKRKRLLIAMDVAFGMEYLHGKNIVHFDLKSDNLLVNLRDPHRPICKVGDLGLSKVKCQTLISGGVRGTLPWMAPELLNGSSSLVSEKVDVFSFGIVLWELLTGEEPYADLHYGAIIGGIVSNTLRPLVPDSCDPEWKSLMERCWSAEPVERPSFTEIASDLRAMAAKIPSRGQTPAQQGSSSAQPQPQK